MFAAVNSAGREGRGATDTAAALGSSPNAFSFIKHLHFCHSKLKITPYNFDGSCCIFSSAEKISSSYVVKSLYFLTSMFVFSMKRLAFPFEDYKHFAIF